MKRFIAKGLIIIVCCTKIAHAQNGIYTTIASGGSFLTGMPSASNMDASSVTQKNIPAFRASIGCIHQIFSTRFGLGFEVGKGIYSRYRYSIHQSTLKAQSSTLELLGVIRMQLPAHNYLYTKLGGIRHTISITYQHNTQDSTRIQPMVALGIIHKLSPHVFCDFSYSISFGQKIQTFIPVAWLAPSVQTVLLGVGISFF